jgi:hypothetical protein
MRAFDSDVLENKQVRVLRLNAKYKDLVDENKKIDGGNTEIVVYLDTKANGLHFWNKKSVKSGDRFFVDACATIKTFDFPDTVALCVQIFKKLPNEFSKPCSCNFGTVNVRLSDLVAHQRGCASQKWFDLPLKMHTVGDVQTGIIYFKMISEKISSANGPTVNSDIVLYKSKKEPLKQCDILSSPFNNFLMEKVSFMLVDNVYLEDERLDNAVKSSNERWRGILTSTGGYKVNDKCSSSSPIIAATSASSSSSAAFISLAKEEFAFEKKIVDEYMEVYPIENALFSDWISGAEKIHCPYYPSQVTLSDTSSFLPYGAFVVYEPPVISSYYWIRALEIALDRKGYESEAEIESYYIDHEYQRLYEKIVLGKEDDEVPFDFILIAVSHAMEVVCQLTHAMEYVTDQYVHPVTKKLEKIELFGDALFTYCDDCDGLALSILQMFDDFTLRQKDFWKNEAHAPGTERNKESLLRRILTVMRILLSNYVPFLCIEGVSCASAQNQHALSESASVNGAHAAVKCLPLSYVKQCLQRWDPDHPILGCDGFSSSPPPGLVNTTASKRVGGGGTSSSFSNLPYAIVLPEGDKKKAAVYDWEDRLPILLGEGTGMLNPSGEKDPCKRPNIRNYVYACDALSCSKKPLYPPKATSPFYKAILFGATNRFLRNFKTTTFRFCRQNENEFHRGVLFPDLVNKSDNVALVPYNSIDTVTNSKNKREFTEALMIVMEKSLNVRLKSKPVFAFANAEEKLPRSTCLVKFSSFRKFEPAADTLRKMKDDDENKKWLSHSNGFHLLAALQVNLYKNATFGSKGRKFTKSSKRVPVSDSVSVYMDDYYVTPENCSNICSHFSKAKLVLNFALERLSNEVTCWRLTFF